ncbi:MAG: hypothetical protein ACQEQ0_06385 [Bacteroidota bacterium]
MTTKKRMGIRIKTGDSLLKINKTGRASILQDKEFTRHWKGSEQGTPAFVQKSKHKKLQF